LCRLYATSSRVQAVIKAGRTGTSDRMSPVSILDYDEGYISKMDAHWRNQVNTVVKKD
jgi:hypothetical protein